MPEIGLNGPSVLAIIGELIAGAVAQHTDVYQERERHACPSHHPLIAGHR